MDDCIVIGRRVRIGGQIALASRLGGGLVCNEHGRTGAANEELH
jgi:hypothetical protein